VSPLTLRRYRAELLLRREFERLRGRVLGTVRGRLRTSGVSLDPSDLEACYAQAWQGLYAAVLEGQEIVNPTGWLALVTFRRAIEEHRARARLHRHGPGDGASVRARDIGDLDPRAALAPDAASEPDFAAELDDRMRLRQLFEGLRGRLTARELQAAALCYLQGLSRAEAAARIGVSETGMRKLMEGRGTGRPGVAAKMGALVETIRGGGWCEEQGSLMRGLAYGVLDPEGERYQLALMHRGECPACRAYVVSLRGLAAVLPAPGLMPWALGVGAGVSAGVGAGAGAGTAGAAGAGSAAGGGWFLAGGGAGAKLAVGCLIAVSVGASCVALTVAPVIPPRAVHHRHVAHVSSAAAPPRAQDVASSPSIAGTQPALSTPAPAGVVHSARTDASAAPTPAAEASREFGLEQPARHVSAPQSSSTAPQSSVARAATVESKSPAPPARPAAPSHTVAGSTVAGSSSSAASAAQREFAPG
jgi:DNA-directed RNA polymerase specialized sigma24 family protein